MENITYYSGMALGSEKLPTQKCVKYCRHTPTNACWTLQNLVPCLLEVGKENLVVDNRKLRIFKDQY